MPCMQGRLCLKGLPSMSGLLWFQSKPWMSSARFSSLHSDLYSFEILQSQDNGLPHWGAIHWWVEIDLTLQKPQGPVVPEVWLAGSLQDGHQALEHRGEMPQIVLQIDFGVMAICTADPDFDPPHISLSISAAILTVHPLSREDARFTCAWAEHRRGIVAGQQQPEQFVWGAFCEWLHLRVGVGW